MLTMFSSLHKFLVTLLRIPRTRGFGVQSPFAYRFLRDVITERWPYYAYDDLKSLSKGEEDRKIGHLMFRLSNYFGSHQWYFGSVDLLQRYKAYILAGCHHASCVATLPCTVEIALLSSDATIKETLQHISDDSVVILHDFRSGSLSYKDIMSMFDVAGATVIFDLYDMGIFFFNSKLHRHIYKVYY